jgi:arylsulfatase A-like enzyme
MVEALDTEIGRLLRSVDLTTTTVIFVGDNGTTRGVVARPYESSKAKESVYQGGVHVPLVVAGRGVSGAGTGRLSDALVNTVDLFPTILEQAGINLAQALPAGLKIDGVTLRPYLQNTAHPRPRTWAYAELFTMRFDGDWHRALRDSSYKLIERYDGSREFYNIAGDPLERSNLLGRTLSSFELSKLNQLDGQLAAVLRSR